MRLARIVWLLVVATSGGAAQRPPSNRASYEFPSRYDAEIAAPMVHRVRYADNHIMLLEVANPPGYPMQMHGHPYPSVFARSSGRTSLGGLGPREQYLEPGGGRNGEHWHSAPPPKGTPALECTAADPQAPHRPVNHGITPQHFFRIEFKRIDEDSPSVVLSGRGVARDRTLFEDAAIRLSEVTVPAGRSGSARATRFPAILAVDTTRAFDALDAVVGGDAGRSQPPTGLSMPRCITLDAGAVLAFRNTGIAPVHYYRIEFKRIEGDALKEHWRDWYPFMATMH